MFAGIRLAVGISLKSSIHCRSKVFPFPGTNLLLSARTLLNVNETSVSSAGVNIEAHGLGTHLGLRQFHIFLERLDTADFAAFFEMQNCIQKVNESRLLFKNLF